MTPAERTTEIEALQQNIRLAGEKHDGSMEKLLADSIAKLTPASGESSTMLPMPTKRSK